MTDADLLSGTIAAKLRLLPEVRHLQPVRPTPLAALRSAVGLVDAVASDPAVSLRNEHGTTVAEVGIGIGDTRPAPEVALAAVRVIRASATDAGALPLRVRVRIASVESVS